MNEPKYKVGDFVYVVDWGKIYSDLFVWRDGERKPLFDWKSPIPNPYGDTDHFLEIVTKPKLTIKGVPYKDGSKEIVSRTPVYKNFKYKILEVIYHPKAGKVSFDAVAFYSTSSNPESRKKAVPENNDYYPTSPIYLLASTHVEEDWRKCYVQIGEDGISLFTPEQFADEKFNALKEAHRGKWSVDMIERARKEFPKELIERIYDLDDNVLFGSSYVKGKVSYEYVPGIYTVDGIPFIICSSVSYDGEGNKGLPEGTIFMNFNDLHKMFKNNKFHG